MFPVVEDKLLPVLILCTIIYVSVSYLQSRRTTKKDSNQTKAATTLLPKSKTTTETCSARLPAAHPLAGRLSACVAGSDRGRLVYIICMYVCMCVCVCVCVCIFVWGRTWGFNKWAQTEHRNSTTIEHKHNAISS